MSEAVSRSGELTSHGRPMAELARPLAIGLLISAAYFVAAEVGIALTMRPAPVSTLWPPNAVVMATLLLAPPRLWWAVLLAALPAHLAVELRAGIPLPMVMSWFVSNSIDALIGAGKQRPVGVRVRHVRHAGHGREVTGLLRVLAGGEGE